MKDLEKKLSSWKDKLTEEETQKDIDYLESLFNIPPESYEEIYKKFDDTFNIKEKEIITLVGNFFIEIEKNIFDLKNSLCSLLRQKKYKSSMYLLRGLIEIILFHIYISHKLFNHLNKSDYKNFLNIFFKANYGHKEFSFKSYELISSDDIFAKAVNKTFGEKIHINDCIEFYKNTDFELKFIEIKKMTHFLTKKKWSENFRDNYFGFIENVKGKDIFLHHIYYQLCEVIHPTSVILNSYDDEITNLNYRTIFNAFISTYIIPIEVACDPMNIHIIETIKKNKVIFREEFNLFLKNQIN